MQIRQGYVDVGAAGAPQLMHFRHAGAGPALVMLHASPMSSAALTPFLGAAAEFVTAIAPDTPGYGWSDPLPEPTGDLTAYVKALNRFVERLGLESFGLYGTATGAQIAIEYAKSHAVDYLILDNAAHFTDAERERIVSGYFPDLSPDRTGSHLTRIWSMARDQGVFFPWHEATAATRLPASGVNTDFTHSMVMDFLDAGADYDRAYRAAFANEKMERLQPVGAPVSIIRWQGSILKPYSDRFDSVEWPDNFAMVYCGPERAQRLEAFRDIVRERAQKEGRDADLPRPPALATRGFAEVAGDRCFHYQRAGASDAPDLLVLHDIGSAARALTPVLEALSADYRVIAPDLPGHGLSFQPDVDEHGPEAMAEALLQLLRSLGRGRWRIIGVRDSAAIATELAARLGADAEELELFNPIDYTGVASEWEMERMGYDFTPDSQGTHLLKTWHMLRDRQLFWPWYETDSGHALAGEAELDAHYLTQRLREFWLAQPALDTLRRAVLGYPLTRQLDKLDCPVKISMASQDPLTGVGRRSLVQGQFTTGEKQYPRGGNSRIAR